MTIEQLLATPKQPSHPYTFDPDWDGLCAVCGGEEGDPTHNHVRVVDSATQRANAENDPRFTRGH